MTLSKTVYSVSTLTGEHEAEEVAGSSQHHPVGRKVSPLNHQGHITEGALKDTHTHIHSYTLPHTDHPSGVLPLSHTCFLRLFMTPMMLDSCLYSSLVAHFLSLFFLEPGAFSGEATPVMSAPGSVRLTLPPSQNRCQQQCAVQLFVVA